MVDAPGLVQRGEHVALDDLVAHVAEVSEQLVVVGLAVGEPLALVVLVAEERLLALGAHEVLHVPVLPEGGHHALLDRTAARAANGDAHLVVAAEAVQLVL